MGKEKFYVTTTIPYANGFPHIGFALEIVQADVLARWNRFLGKDVFFLTGTDEHGVKNYQTAKKQGLNTQEFVDKNSDAFENLTKGLNISNDSFIRTTDKKRHWPGVVEMWKKLLEKGDIYKKKYVGNYCSGCERFITEKDLINEECPDHPTLKIQEIEEENYFFKLSKYSDKIKKLIETDKLEIFPVKWKNNFLALIKDGLTDVSFSRDKKVLPWGIPVPEDKDQVMYVWCDALTNYLTGIGYPKKEFEKYWPADVHVVGKDMLRFHTGIWPGMLLSAGLSLPKKVIVHGFLTVGGKKMSKSGGNVIEPLKLLKKYSADAIRYVLLRSIPFGDDGNFSEKALVNRHNGELSNKLGNLVSRVTGLIEKNGVEKTKNSLKFDFKKVNKLMQNFEIDKSLNEIFAFIDLCNEYVQDKKPWETKDKKVLYELADAIKKISILLSAFIPETCEKIADKFGGWEFSLEEFEKPLGDVKVVKGENLFGRIEVEEKVEEVKKEKVGKIVKPKVPVLYKNKFPKNFVNDAEGWNFTQEELIKNKGKLLTLDIDFGDVCSLNCPHCFRKNNKVDFGKGKQMSYQETMQLIKDAKKLGLKSVKFLGAGEPFENKKFIEFLRFLKDLDIIPLIFTKGQVIGDDKLAKFWNSDYGITSSKELIEELKKVNASILLGFNSFDLEKQDKMVGGVKGYTLKRNNALELLVNAGFNKHQPTKLALISTPITLENCDEILEIYKWARIRNLYVITCPTMVSGRCAETSAWEKITPSKQKLVKLYAEIYNFNMDKGIQTLSQIEKEGISAYAGACPCNQVACGMYVTLGGIVLRCPSDDTTVFGDLRKTSLKEIWENSENYERTGTFNCGCPPKIGKSISSTFFKEVMEEVKKNKVSKKEKIEAKKPNIKKENEPKEIMEGVTTIQFDDFAKVELKVAEIKEVEEIPKADKLYKLTLDDGTEEGRIICAGIKEFYSMEELKDKKIIIVANLAPRKLRGIESCGMLLAASNDGHSVVSLISPDKEINNGSRVG